MNYSRLADKLTVDDARDRMKFEHRMAWAVLFMPPVGLLISSAATVFVAYSDNPVYGAGTGVAAAVSAYKLRVPAKKK